VYIKGENLEGENVEMMYDLCKMAPEGVICASDYIAAILTLDQKRFSIDYAGVLSSRKGNRSVYAVTLKSIQSKT